MPTPIHRPGLRMLLVAVVVIVTVVSAGGRSAAQSTTVTTTDPEPTTLTVTGMGTVRIEPDTASVSFGVLTEDETLSTAQAESTETMTAILAAVTDAGVEERDIQTANFSVTIVYDYDDDGNVTRVLGYEVANTVTVTVRQLDTLGGMLDAVVSAGANTVSGINFYVEDTTDAARQARIAAVKDALSKANDIATAAGLRVGRIVSISEESSAPPIPVDVYAAADAESASVGSAVPVQAGTSVIQASVYMVIELEPAA